MASETPVSSQRPAPAAAVAGAAPVAQRPAPLSNASYAPLRAEAEVRDCQIEGKLPADLSGGFYAVGPDPQYPLAPGNILFDGERVWLVDWELAFGNDPLVDIAILTTELAETPELEDALLEAAFSLKPNRPLRARLGVIRLLTRLFYGCVVLDSQGFIKTGPDLSSEDLTGAHWPLSRRPYLLETSLPGVFATGDVRGGNIKRVASAVGEGSIAISFVHQFLRE